jgi:F-type H+-transporting ATPase subunit a
MEHHAAPVSWLLKLPLLPHDPALIHVNGAVVVFLFITVVSVLANRAIKNRTDTLIVPSPKLNLVTLIDWTVESIHKMVMGILGHHGEQFFPFIASILIFILCSNFLGLIPHSASPSTSVNTTFALGIATFLYYHLMGIKSHGLVGYGKHFLMGLGIFGIPIALLEIISHLVRPVSLGVRLWLNLKVDHELLHSFEQIFAWIIPAPMLLFGILVCTIQAFVFTILTTVYILMATEHEEGH